MCCLTGWKVKPKIFFSVKKNLASIFEKSKIPSIQLVTNINLNNLYIRNFWFLPNWRRTFFFYISFFAWNLPPVVNFLNTFFMKCENFVLFHDFLYSPLNLGPEKCNCMQIHHSLKLVINAYFCPKTMLGDLKPVVCMNEWRKEGLKKE